MLLSADWIAAVSSLVPSPTAPKGGLRALMKPGWKLSLDWLIVPSAMAEAVTALGAKSAAVMAPLAMAGVVTDASARLAEGAAPGWPGGGGDGARGEGRRSDRLRGEFGGGDGAVGQGRRDDRVHRQLSARDGASGNARSGDGPGGQVVAGHGAIGHTGGHHRKPGRIQALVRGQPGKAVGAIVKPDSQPHVGIGKNSRTHRLHVGIAEDNREETSSDEVGDRLIGLASSDAGAVIAPKRGRAIAVNQREFEEAGAAIRHGAGTEGPLISYRLWNLCLRGWQGSRQPRSNPQISGCAQRHKRSRIPSNRAAPGVLRRKDKADIAVGRTALV